MTICEEAAALVKGARRESYGHPLDDFTRTAKLWSAILGHEITAEQAALCMVALKISRECHAPGRDNRVDGAGYFQVLDHIVEERLNRGAGAGAGKASPSLTCRLGDGSMVSVPVRAPECKLGCSAYRGGFCDCGRQFLPGDIRP